MPRQSISSIRSRLATLITVCLLPASLIAVGLLAFDYYQGRDKLVDNSRMTARTIASLVDKDFASIEATLRVLATSPSLATQDLGAFYQQAQAVLKTQPVNNFVLTAVSGQQLINTLIPFGAPLPRSGNPTQLRRLSETDGPLISGLFPGDVTRRPVIAIAIPVRINGRHLYNLAAVIFPEQFARLLQQQQLPPDWITAVLDGNGVIVARSHDMQRYVGQRGARSLTDALAMDNEGYFDGTTSEGTSVLAVFSRSTVTNWAVAIGIPTKGLTADLRTTLAWLAFAIAVLFCSCLGLAWVIGGKISKSIRALTAPALALGTGKEVSVPEFYLREADEVGKALIRASNMLRQAQHQATHDILTGLPNRALLAQIAEQQISLCHRTGANLSVLYLDLDGFKAVNDTYGHAAGDRLLCQAAERLTSSIRESDVAARLGGDEFAVLLVGASAAKAAAIAKKLVDILSAPYKLGNVQASVSVSIGVAGYPEHGTGSQALLRVADEAMYQAKAGGKRQVASA